jgi:hypothetical protein
MKNVLIGFMLATIVSNAFAGHHEEGEVPQIRKATG